ncbi:MAG: hypothetical protein AAFO07_08560 [Bacteroidota bacterium]
MLSGFSTYPKTTSRGTHNGLEAFYQNNQLSPQWFTINPQRFTTIVGKYGTRIVFPPFALTTDEGQAVTGTVQLALFELVNKSDMILAKTYSSSEDNALEVAGQIYLQAYQDGMSLRLSKPTPIEMPLWHDVTNPLALRLYGSSYSSTYTVVEQASFEWKMIDKRRVKLKKQGDQKYLHFFLLDFDWVCCAQAIQKKGNGLMVSAKYVHALEELDSKIALLSFNNSNGIVRMHSSANRFSRFNIPTKQSATVMIIGSLGHRLFAGTTHIEKLNKEVIRTHLKEVNENEILAMIYSL